MSATSILLGTMLTFATTDGRMLQLSVSLTQPATVALAWGDLARSSTVARRHHTFKGLPIPEGAPTTYVLSVAGEEPQAVKVDPIGTPDHLRVALYGDSRDGTAPHRLVLDQILAQNVDLIVHSGDMVRNAQDERGWIEHLTASFPLSSRRPIILALGNHELQGSRPSSDGLARAMQEIPPPEDALARSVGAPVAAFHVRVGPALFISLDSNQSMAEGTAQLAFLKRAIAEKGDARLVFVCYHHGPMSSGPHGPHPDAADVIKVLEANPGSVSVAGHDHIYERIVQNGVTYLISGGGGAPLYRKGAETPGSLAFASTYNWVLVDLLGEHAPFEAFSLEGTTLDRGDLLEPRGSTESGHEPWQRPVVILAFAVLLGAFTWAGLRFARSSSHAGVARDP